jgi:hypothetical protein
MQKIVQKQHFFEGFIYFRQCIIRGMENDYGLDPVVKMKKS